MAKTRNELIITNGSEIAIIGGGPAGSLFARFACEYASKRGIDVNVTIYTNRQFSDAGPKGCKGCVGVVNERLNEKLKQAHIVIPEELIMQNIDDIQWNMFTGHETYKNIFWNFFEPRLQLELGIEVVKEILERLRKKCRLT